MKKSTAGLTFAAVVGFAVLSATPAMAVTGTYVNCTEAAAVGVYNIPAGAPGYTVALDSDKDGIGCENAKIAYSPAAAAPVTTSQVVQKPVGGANTGVAHKSTNNTGVLALGAGLVLVAAAGGTFVLRRRNA